MPLKVGITGGIGSGKTTVCKIFELLKIPVYYADDRAKWLMNNDPELIKALKTAFGNKVYHQNGTLNRAYLANIIFNDKQALKKVNAIVHPVVGQDGNDWHEQQGDVPYTLKEAALFFENGTHKLMDYMITVTAPESMRIQRVIARDNTTTAAVKARIDKQLPESEKVRQSDFIIKNDSQHSLILQVINIHRTLEKTVLNPSLNPI